MARQTLIKLLDDIDGGDADRTVEFAVDGTSYTIDLSDANIGRLRTALDPYIKAGRRTGRAATRPAARQVEGPAARRERNVAIREWAAENGHELAERGRIPAHVVEAYERAA